MRSLLFVPADDAGKLEKALTSGADALILDLGDSIAGMARGRARRMALEFLQANRAAGDRLRLYVRINALQTPLSEGDLEAVMPGAPDGIVLPKASGGADVALLDSRLAVGEALHGLVDGQTRIVAIATESAAAMFGLATYAGCSRRLAGLAWSGDDLAADLGARSAGPEAGWSEPFRLARSLCLFAAASAKVPAIDTVHTELRDLAGLEAECEAAARDGFSAKLAIHPDQVAVINQAFTRLTAGQA